MELGFTETKGTRFWTSELSYIAKVHSEFDLSLYHISKTWDLHICVWGASSYIALRKSFIHRIGVGGSVWGRRFSTLNTKLWAGAKKVSGLNFKNGMETTSLISGWNSMKIFEVERQCEHFSKILLRLRHKEKCKILNGWNVPITSLKIQFHFWIHWIRKEGHRAEVWRRWGGLENQRSRSRHITR